MSDATAEKRPAARRRRPWRAVVIGVEVLVLAGLLATLWYRWEVKRTWRAAVLAVEQNLGPAMPGQYKMPWVAGHRNGFTWLTAGSAAMPNDQGLEDVRSVADQPPDRWPAESTVAELMQRYRPALELLHGATDHPELGLAIEYGAGHRAAMPNLVSYHQAARALAAHARWSLWRGDQPAALASIRSLALLARGLEQEPVLIAKLIGASIERRLHRVVADWISSPWTRSPDAEALAELDGLLAGLPQPIGYPRALGFEAAATLRALGVEGSAGLSQWRVRLLGSLCASELAMRYAEIGRRSSEPFAQVRSDLWSEEGLIGSAERRGSWRGRLCEPELRRFAVGPDVPLRLELSESSRRLVRVGVELAASASRDGGYPLDLGSVPSALAEPAAGESPRYEVRPDGSVTVSYPAAKALAAEYDFLRQSPLHVLRLELPALLASPPPASPAR